MTKLGPKFCDQCGKPAGGGIAFCKYCGNDLTLVPVTFGSEDKKTTPKRGVSNYKEALESRLKKLLGDKTLDENSKINAIIHSTGIVCGIIALQPIPFADFFILTPLQIIMTLYIGRAYGFEITWKRAAEICAEILGVIGAALISMNAIIAGYKTVIPYAGGLFTLPLVWAATYGIGSAAKVYYSFRKNTAKPLTAEQKKSIRLAYLREYKEKKNTRPDKIKQEVENFLKEIKDSGSQM